MTRSLHVVVPGSIAQRTGGYIYDARMVAGLRTRGWHVTVHELAGVFPAGDEVARRSVHSTLSSLPAYVPVVVDGLALGSHPDVVEEHGRRLRLVALVHLSLADETGLTAEARRALAAAERNALAHCDGVVATSAFAAARLASHGVEPARLRVVIPGTDRAAPARGPGAGQPPRLLCVGSVTPRKGQDVLVRALETLTDLSWECVCVGSLTRHRAFADRVRQQIDEAGLSDRIQLTGECDPDAVARFYETSSLFVLPSHFESYGMVLTEALAHALPVVTTTGGAIPETVPPTAGLLVPPGEPPALAQALRRLLSDPGTTDDRRPGMRQRLAASALAHASTLPTWDEAAEAFARAVNELVDTKEGQPPGDVQPNLA